MPWIALVVLGVLGGCSFEADYAGGVYRCSDQQSKCPSGMDCLPNLDNDLVCQPKRMDASIDVPGMGDGMQIDAPPPHMLNCDDPQPLTNSVAFTGTTTQRSNKVSATCLNRTMLGLDAIHAITPGAGKMMQVAVTATHAATAYVISACPQSTCNGNIYATTATAANVYTLAGPHYIVVDSAASNVFGDYTVTVQF